MRLRGLVSELARCVFIKVTSRLNLGLLLKEALFAAILSQSVI